MNLADFDFDLPDALIAQEPAPDRERSRLLVVDRGAAPFRHRVFQDLLDELDGGDLLVLNDTRVLPARLRGFKASGGRVEVLLVEPTGGPRSEPTWRAMVRAGHAPVRGARLRLSGEIDAEVLGRDGDLWLLRLSHPSGDPLAAVEAAGEMPLPSYIRRKPGDTRHAADRERYQTVFARRPGAVAAPTAGLHFSRALLQRLTTRGIGLASITLHVGPGTFLPIRTADVGAHRMHEEAYEIPSETAAAVAEAHGRGNRIVAVGTTVVRTLESAASDDGRLTPGAGRTALFIRPGFRFRVVDALVTNFHLPRSTLLMLVCAFGGRERILAAYREAVADGYRFFSYGDAMLVRSR